jgi:hypothetical protein
MLLEFALVACVMPSIGGVDELLVTASDGSSLDEFGTAIALSADTALVGVPLEAPSGLAEAGAVYVYVRSGTNWIEQTKLVAQDAAASDRFGISVDLEGDTALIGASHKDDRGMDSGAVYVFTRSGTTWSQEAVLTATDGQPDDRFGAAVALSGDTAVVGAHLDDDLGADAGSAYVLVRSGTSWSEEAKLLAPDGLVGDEFGSAVALDADTAVVGAPLVPASFGGPRGRAYVFARSGTSWALEESITGANGDELGTAVAVSGDRTLLGAPSPDGPSFGLGRVRVYERSGTTWSLTRTLEGHDLGIQSTFGASVALEGDIAVVGDPTRSNSTGRSYVFEQVADTWVLSELPRTDVTLGDRHGFAVALSGDRVVVGAPGDDAPETDAGSCLFYRLREVSVTRVEDSLLAPADGVAGEQFGISIAVDGDVAVVGARLDGSSGTSGGSAYVYRRIGSTWTEEAEVFAPDAAFNDLFGSFVAIDGDTLLVGSPCDDTLSGSNAGSAYVFVRNGSSWDFQAKLRAVFDGSAEDGFGSSVALEGDLAMIGSPNWGPVATGAVYVFERSGTTWAEVARLVADDGFPGDRIGSRVDLSGSTVLIGSPSHGPEGAVYVFSGSGTTWTQQADLPLPSSFPLRNFGYDVEIQGDRAVIGAVSGAGNDLGGAYVYERSGTTWSLDVELIASGTEHVDGFGGVVSLDGDTLVVLASADNDAGQDSGSAYVFLHSSGQWVEREKCYVSNAAPFDGMGLPLLAGSELFVGRPGAITGPDLGAVLVYQLDNTFPSFCDASDGSLASCPCGNAGDPDTGCDIQQGTGGVRIDVVTQDYLPLNRATLVGSGFPTMGTPSAVLLRGSTLEPTPVVLGDGIRCVGVPVVRIGVGTSIGGTSEHTFGHGIGAGNGTFYYQLWLRNQPTMFCTPEAFNVSNGRALTW